MPGGMLAENIWRNHGRKSRGYLWKILGGISEGILKEILGGISEGTSGRLSSASIQLAPRENQTECTRYVYVKCTIFVT